MDLTEAEDIKKRWQEYTEELYKEDLHDPDNHDGGITDLEPDILECEVKWSGCLSPEGEGLQPAISVQSFVPCAGHVQAGFRKGRGTRDQIANICWIIKKVKEFQKKIYFCFIDYAKAETLLC